MRPANSSTPVDQGEQMNEMSDIHDDLRQGVRQLCARYPNEYWRELDEEEAYPSEFVKVMTAAGYLAALIPETYGGIGVGVTEASIILEEIHRAGDKTEIHPKRLNNDKEVIVAIGVSLHACSKLV